MFLNIDVNDFNLCMFACGIQESLGSLNAHKELVFLSHLLFSFSHFERNNFYELNKNLRTTQKEVIVRMPDFDSKITLKSYSNIFVCCLYIEI